MNYDQIQRCTEKKWATEHEDRLQLLEALHHKHSHRTEPNTDSIADCRWVPVHDPTGLLPDSNGSMLVSLDGSVDERFYSTVASVFPVTASASSLELRRLLDADWAPDIAKVVQHLVNLMKRGGLIESAEQASRSLEPLYQQVISYFCALCRYTVLPATKLQVFG